ncbi:hypothetical protein ACO1GZ_07110 [Fusobacterium watanabei]|uniref:hypothetical protein n=1 Tax=Fusobacterium TaxID=848 RepID=UPI0030CC1FF8
MEKFIEFGNNIVNTKSISRIFRANEFKDDYRIVLITVDGTMLEIKLASLEIMNQVFVVISNKLTAKDCPIIPEI